MNSDTREPPWYIPTISYRVPKNARKVSLRLREFCPKTERGLWRRAVPLRRACDTSLTDTTRRYTAFPEVSNARPHPRHERTRASHTLIPACAHSSTAASSHHAEGQLRGVKRWRGSRRRARRRCFVRRRDAYPSGRTRRAPTSPNPPTVLNMQAFMGSDRGVNRGTLRSGTPLVAYCC